MKRSLRQKMAAGLAAVALACPLSIGMAPAPTAEAGDMLGNILGAAVGGAVYSAQLNKEINYINNTKEGRNEYFAEMKKQYGVNDDWSLNNRLDGIMTNLTAAIGQVDGSIYDKPYQYFINKDDSFNAFCTLGHNMSVNQGLFNYIDNDDEIAVVLGHEMGHGQKDHPAKGAKRSIGPAVLSAATGGSVLGNIAANLWNNRGITRPMEWEADNLAFDYITHSNYNPGATAAIWQRVIEKMGDNNAFSNSVSDHPGNAERRDNYEKKLQGYSNYHVAVKNGVVTVNKQNFCTPAAAGGMSSKERAYFVEGNLAAAFHNGHNKSTATVSGNTVMLGAQPIITCTADDESASVLAERLNSLKDK